MIRADAKARLFSTVEGVLGIDLEFPSNLREIPPDLVKAGDSGSGFLQLRASREIIKLLAFSTWLTQHSKLRPHSSIYIIYIPMNPVFIAIYMYFIMYVIYTYILIYIRTYNVKIANFKAGHWLYRLRCILNNTYQSNSPVLSGQA